MTLKFNNPSSVPSTSSVVDALNEALSSGQISLDIVPGSIIAQVTTTTTTSGSSPLSMSHSFPFSLALVFFTAQIIASI
ncbi:hypothetical protein AAFF_G00307440 [Aldrovandia affinis]|uniref:Uncharacterized protein n=1 Tax=Aldrovandia affinis TaxID=143900 RepID=A0AAD7R833_9TELE|nr:hypothetical protein AAFF_G00307440 [Aldrovandia affinis]